MVASYEPLFAHLLGIMPWHLTPPDGSPGLLTVEQFERCRRWVDDMNKKERGAR